MTDIRARIAGLAESAAVLAVLFSLATLAERLHRLLELFSHFRLQYLVGTAVLALVFLALQKRRWALAMLVLTAINALPVVPWYVSDARAQPATGTAVRILLSNIRAANDSTARLVDVVAKETPDLVFVQELTAQHGRELAALRDGYPYSLNMPRSDNFGIAVLSRLPFAAARVIQSPPFDFPTLLVQVDLSGQRVTFLTTHPVPPMGQAGYAGRNEQLAHVAGLMAGVQGPKVLVGDLNTTMWSHHFSDLLASTGLADTRQGFGIVPTWPTQLPMAMIPLDHCLVSSEFLTMDTHSGPRVGSDHLPLIVDLLLPNQDPHE